MKSIIVKINKNNKKLTIREFAIFLDDFSEDNITYFLGYECKKNKADKKKLLKKLAH